MKTTSDPGICLLYWKSSCYEGYKRSWSSCVLWHHDRYPCFPALVVCWTFLNFEEIPTLGESTTTTKTMTTKITILKTTLTKTKTTKKAKREWKHSTTTMTTTIDRQKITKQKTKKKFQEKSDDQCSMGIYEAIITPWQCMHIVILLEQNPTTQRIDNHT